MRITALVGLMLLCFGCARRVEVKPHRQQMLAERHHNAAVEMLEAGETVSAEHQLRAAIEADPFHGLAHANLGALLLQQKELYDAAWHLRYATQLMPRASQPRANLGLLFALSGQAEKAEQHFRQALERNPADLEIAGHLVRLQLRHGMATSETELWLQRISSEDPDPKWRKWATQQYVRHFSKGANP